VGELSDRYGRKPFIIAALLLALLPISAIMLHLRNGLSLLW
jgi:MFS family permease